MVIDKKQKIRNSAGVLLRWLALSLMFVAAHALAQTGGTVTYIYTDPQGTPLAETDASGNITATFEYTPYGTYAPQGTSTPGAAPKGPGYTGHVNDAETNLVYMQARYYEPATGRFLSIDPIGLSASNSFTFNRYAYADNNPALNFDPNGKSTCADKDCQTSTIDHALPRANAQPPPVNGQEGIDANSRLGRQIQGGYVVTVTFINDDPGGPSPDKPVTTATAKMVESAISNSGVESVNINSTTGGHHAPTSNHPKGRAVDINKIDGAKVSDLGKAGLVKVLQDSFSNEPNIRENFGPAYQQKTSSPGSAPKPWPGVSEDHQNHIHEASQQ